MNRLMYRFEFPEEGNEPMNLRDMRIRELEAELDATRAEVVALRDEFLARRIYWKWNPKSRTATCYRLPS